MFSFFKKKKIIPHVKLSGVIGNVGKFKQGIDFTGQEEILKKAFSIKKALAVAISINSPGGSPVQSHLIHDFIRYQAKKNKKKVIIFSEYVAATGQYAFLPRQPAGRYTKTAKKVGNAEPGDQVKFGVDPTGPTGGSLLANLIQTPSLAERAAQGREVGYAIIFVGLIGIGLAFWKLWSLYVLGKAVRAQAGSKTLDVRNPLGRVLKVGEENFKKDIDTLELKLAEAIMAERPSIERGIGAVRIISVVAPLAGLLGTVTGMIVTFQMITLYGTGDPKLMAGGISQALVTTVLGLLVAIPTTLLHSFTASSAKGIISVLEEQSTGILAERAEGS